EKCCGRLGPGAARENGGANAQIPEIPISPVVLGIARNGTSRCKTAATARSACIAFTRTWAAGNGSPTRAMTNYIELHARSAFSFLEGASVPEEFAEVCAAQQMPAMAMLDRDGVYGAPRFYFAAKKLKIKAHIGAEVTSLLSPIPSDALLPPSVGRSAITLP